MAQFNVGSSTPVASVKLIQLISCGVVFGWWHSSGKHIPSSYVIITVIMKCCQNMPDVDLRIPVNINGRGCKAHEVLTGSALGARMIGCRVNLGGKDHQVNTWLLELIGGGKIGWTSRIII